MTSWSFVLTRSDHPVRLRPVDVTAGMIALLAFAAALWALGWGTSNPSEDRADQATTTTVPGQTTVAPGETGAVAGTEEQTAAPGATTSAPSVPIEPAVPVPAAARLPRDQLPEALPAQIPAGFTLAEVRHPDGTQFVLPEQGAMAVLTGATAAGPARLTVCSVADESQVHFCGYEGNGVNVDVHGNTWTCARNPAGELMCFRPWGGTVVVFGFAGINEPDLSAALATMSASLTKDMGQVAWWPRQ